MPTLPDFPPLITGHRLDRGKDPFVVAARRAAGGKAGAGDLYWSGASDRMAAAIVLVPEVDAATVQAVHLAVMVALGDCIGALAPPEVGIFYRWPETILANGAVVGSARFAAAPVADRRQAPEWVVSGVDVRVRLPPNARDPGYNPEATTLWDEGCGTISRTALLESFSRHLKTWLYTFENEGPRPAVEAWMARAAERGKAVSLDCCGATKTGTFLGLDETGDMILKTEAGTELLPLAGALV